MLTPETIRTDVFTVEDLLAKASLPEHAIGATSTQETSIRLQLRQACKKLIRDHDNLTADEDANYPSQDPELFAKLEQLRRSFKFDRGGPVMDDEILSIRKALEMKDNIKKQQPVDIDYNATARSNARKHLVDGLAMGDEGLVAKYNALLLDNQSNCYDPTYDSSTDYQNAQQMLQALKPGAIQNLVDKLKNLF